MPATETRTRKKARQGLELLTQKHAKNVKDLLEGADNAQWEMMFRIYDQDGDGHITSTELAQVMRSMGKRPYSNKIQRLLEEMDTDHNGTIELDEFIAYMNKIKETKGKAKRTTAVPDSEETKEEPPATPSKGTPGKGRKRKASVKKPKEEDKLYAIKSLLDVKEVNGKKSYLVSWEGYDDSHNTWEPEENIDIPGNEELIEELAARGKSESKEEEAPVLVKTVSIVTYYNAAAGLNTIEGAPVDKFRNAEGTSYDLGRDQAFTSFSIIIGSFYPVKNMDQVQEALQSKGFKTKLVTEVKALVDDIANHDIAWIIPTKDWDDTTTKEEFVDAVYNFQQRGGGLFIWAENEPYHLHANLILKKLYGDTAELSGSTPAEKELSLGDGKTPGTFGNHLITTGITHLFEGRTVCFFENPPAQLEAVATSTDGKAVCLASNAKIPAHHGRVVVDCGFTKLFLHWDTAGTARYVKNACVWLLGLDSRIANNAPLKGKIEEFKKEEAEWIWQYQHGSWHNYDESAGAVVEHTYQLYLKEPHIDVRAVKSGHFKYMVDFTNMTQQNVEHWAKTKRAIRRVHRANLEKEAAAAALSSTTSTDSSTSSSSTPSASTSSSSSSTPALSSTPVKAPATQADVVMHVTESAPETASSERPAESAPETASSERPAESTSTPEARTA